MNLSPWGVSLATERRALLGKAGNNGFQAEQCSALHKLTPTDF
jgi:hypothetical protein